MKGIAGPVFPIPVAFHKNGKIDFHRIEKYLQFLSDNKACYAMTTAGTSQFNLLSNTEISELNRCVYNGFGGDVILGIPALSEYHLCDFIDDLAQNCPKATFMIFYPERYYAEDDVISFFQRVTHSFPIDFFFHGLPMTDGKNGSKVNYSSFLVNQMIRGSKNLKGMKEESTSYEYGFEFCSKINSVQDFDIVVAGGSMRRFLLLSAGGAKSFLSGVGSLFPTVELAFYDFFCKGRHDLAIQIMRELETVLFDVFMRIGWHRALKYAFAHLNYYDPAQRAPMALPTKKERNEIRNVIQIIEDKIILMSNKGIL